MQLIVIFVLQARVGDFLHDANNKVTGAYKGIKDVDLAVAQRLAEFFFENLLHTAHDEVDDGLGGIDDAVGVRLFGREALEEALIDGVEEGLLLRKVGGILGVDFYGVIEAVQVFQESVAAEMTAGDRINDLLDLCCNDVASAYFQ